MITTNTSIVITINVIDVVIARPIIKPVLELPLVDDVGAKKVKYKYINKIVLTCCLNPYWYTCRSFDN